MIRSPAFLVFAMAALLAVGSVSAAQYKPVFFLHGVTGAATDFILVKKWTDEARNGSWSLSLPVFERNDSFVPIFGQAFIISNTIRNIVSKEPELFANGYHLVCHSQGGLICRTIIEIMDDHNVDTFISLAGVQNGQYKPGPGEGLFANVSAKQLPYLVYSHYYQQTFSIANFWRDPNHEDLYLRFCALLPYVNNEIKHDQAARFKKNFLRLKRLVLTASPQDGVISPYQSSLFGFVDKRGKPYSMNETRVFKQDTFGLRTLATQNRLIIHDIPNVAHSMWLYKTDLFEKYILPYLV